MRGGVFFLALAALLALALGAGSGMQHVGESALKKRDEALKSRSDVQTFEYDASKGSYDHLPVIKFHYGGVMDLASITVVGTKRGEPDPFDAEVVRGYLTTTRGATSPSAASAPAPSPPSQRPSDGAW